MEKVLVFGMGNLFREKEIYVRENFEIRGFLDNRVGRDSFIDGNNKLPVYHPEDKKHYLKNDIKIVLMSYQYHSMWDQLKKLGIDGDRILFGIMFPPLSNKGRILFDKGRLAIEDGEIVYLGESDEKIFVQNYEELEEVASVFLRDAYRKKYPLIHEIAKMNIKPVSRKFGLERGKAIDRYYIEQFLYKNESFIHGDCLEVADNTYTLKYGGTKVKNSYILHVKGWGENAIKGNFETGEGIEENRYDCAIITQTLMYTFDLRKSVENIYRLLKKNGSALITVAGIAQISRYDADIWGSYYGFHEDAMRKLFEPLFGRENVIVQTYGNVKTSIALLYGMCQEDLKIEDFEVNDKDYPVIVSVIATKKE